jgi:hypothetical protein
MFDTVSYFPQIELKLKICKGFSRRRALVHEASSLRASKLILGATRNKHKHGYVQLLIQLLY